MASQIKGGILVLLGFTVFMWYAISANATSARQVDIVRTNNVYLRVNSCILSVPIAERTVNYIQDCYNKAEKANNITVDHYGRGE